MATFTKIVADSGDIDSIRKYLPTDATTNPSLLLQASQLGQYNHSVEDAIAYGQKNAAAKKKSENELTLDRLAVNFGTEIAGIVPGVVSTEVDARLSFDTNAMIAKGRDLIAMYEEKGINRSRVLIKLASTWEGVQASKVLEAEGIHCNMTLLFSFVQAAACAEAGATLISPFVGRITDWFKKDTGTKDYPPESDPGVLSVQRIFYYFKKFNYRTIVMGASFRNKGQILHLAGCDKLTIAPSLLEELRKSKESVKQMLNPQDANKLCTNTEKLTINEATFRWMLNEDQMATEKLSEGIRKFAADAIALEKVIAAKCAKTKPSPSASAPSS